MPDKERGSEVEGTMLERVMDLFAREAILEWIGKPASRNFDDYGDYLEALVTWKMAQPLSQQVAAAKTLLDDFATYEDYTQNLIDWKRFHYPPQQVVAAKPLVDEFENHDDYAESMIGWKISQLQTLRQGTDDALRKAIATREPADWIEFRNFLDEWGTAGIRPVAFSLPFGKGDHKATWLFDRAGDGIAGHRDNGSMSWFWSEEGGAQVWSQEKLSSTIQ